MYESHEEDTSKKLMFHLPDGLLLTVLCFNSSYPVLNKLQQLQIWEVKQNTLEYKRKPTYRSKMAEEAGYKNHEADSQCSILSAWKWYYVVYQLPLGFITFKYSFSLCHICTTLWKILIYTVVFLRYSWSFQNPKKPNYHRGREGINHNPNTTNDWNF